MRDRLITKRQKNKKIIGCIREIEPYLPNSCKYIGKYYALFDTEGNFIAKDINYNNLHKNYMKCKEEMIMNSQYEPYIGSHKGIMGCEVYIKFPTGYVCGKVVEYIFPKRGIIGTYKVERKDGKCMSATTVYTKNDSIKED